MTISEYIGNKLGETVVAIQTSMQARNINATGTTSKSFHVNEVEEGKHWQLVGGGQNCAPVGTLEIGRKGGKIPKDFASIIYEWGVAKGLGNWTMKSAASVAWTIARKGTKRHREPQDVYSTIVQTAQNDIIVEASGLAGLELKTKVSKAVHDIFKQ